MTSQYLYRYNVNKCCLVLTLFPSDDVNECDTDNGGCDQICTDTPSSFQCSCMAGYTLSSNGFTCMDNDECTDGTDNCQQVCVNTAGGFRCECNSGFQINSDQMTCSGKMKKHAYLAMQGRI